MFMRAKLEKKHENGLKKHSIFEKLGSFYDLFRTFAVLVRKDSKDRDEKLYQVLETVRCCCL